MIYVFKTSVRTKAQVRKIHECLNKTVSKGKWNFDLEDCDKILRIDSEEDIVVNVTRILKDHHFHCMELEDYQMKL